MPGIIPKVDSETFAFPDEVVDRLAQDLGDLGGTGVTLPIDQSDVTGLTDALAAKADDTDLVAKGDKVVLPAYRFRIDASTWESRPTGYKTVVTIGADPAPADLATNDIRVIPRV